VLGRPPPSAAVYHGGYYSQEDVAQVCKHLGGGQGGRLCGEAEGVFMVSV
jgi:hypothetical protein